MKVGGATFGFSDVFRCERNGSHEKSVRLADAPLSPVSLFVRYMRSFPFP